jgi:hypothetical protein
MVIAAVEEFVRMVQVVRVEIVLAILALITVALRLMGVMYLDLHFVAR